MLPRRAGAPPLQQPARARLFRAERNAPMKRIASVLVVTLCATLSATACKGDEKAAAAASGPLQTEEQKTAYALGLMVGRNLTPLKLSAEELALVQRGLIDAATGKKAEVELEAYGPKVQQMAQTRSQAYQTEQAAAEKTKGQTFVDDAAKQSGAVKTASGMVFQSLKPGTGETPKATDTVSVHYQGTLTNGTEFDSSIKRGQPAEFPLNGVIPCWTEGLQKMKVGEKAKLVCPSAIAYGDQGRPPQIPPGATLVFEVELLSIKK
jgi:FKBP-type peptidyl-prolyl cis-trans isomerase FkpA